MTALGGVFARLEPDAVVTIADRHETLATAVAASYQNIPLVHVQGGEVTGSIDDRVRGAITQLADLHLVATETARWRVHSRTAGTDGYGLWGQSPPIHVTGCPSIDLVARAKPLEALHDGVGAEVDLSRPFLIVMQHPVTTEYGEASLQVWETIHAVQLSGLPAVWMWPNVDAGTDALSKSLRMWREGVTHPVRFVRNVNPEYFAGLAKRAAAIVGNSSFGIREASYLGLPAVNIGTRQQGRERASNVTDVPHESEQIRRAIMSITNYTHLYGCRYPSSTLYGDGKAGQRIADYLAEELSRRKEAA